MQTFRSLITILHALSWNLTGNHPNEAERFYAHGFIYDKLGKEVGESSDKGQECREVDGSIVQVERTNTTQGAREGRPNSECACVNLGHWQKKVK